MQMEFKIGQQYTVISGTGHKTEKSEILLAGFNSKNETYSYRARRPKEGFGSIRTAELCFSLVLVGHNLPLDVYTKYSLETGIMRFDFITDSPDQVRACIENNCVNLNPWKITRIFFFQIGFRVKEHTDGIRLFPGVEN
jgi:hypothetical protein